MSLVLLLYVLYCDTDKGNAAVKSFWVVRTIYRGKYVKRFVRVPRARYVIPILAFAFLVFVILHEVL